MQIRTATLLTVVGTGLMLLPGGVAEAQERVSQGGGTALDANQQAGGGRVNPAAEQPDYRARNDLVTGNVAGGRGFRDTVGYTTEGAFRDNVGSDDLFRFQADSFNSNPYRPSINYDSAYSNGGATPVYSTFTDPLGYRANVPGGLDAGRLNRPEYDLATGLIALPDRSTRVNDSAVSLNLGGGQDERVTASPLLGLRSVNADRSLDLPIQGEDPSDPFARPETPDTTRPTQRDEQRDTDPRLDRNADDQTDLNEQARLDLRAGRNQDQDREGDLARRPDGAPLEEGEDGVLPDGAAAERFAQQDGRVATTLVLGAQLQDAKRRQLRDLPTGAEADGAAPADQVQADQKRQQRAADLARENIFKPLENADDEAVEEDPYLKLLQQIRGANGEGLDDGAADERQEWMNALENPAQQELDRAENDARNALRSALGLGEDEDPLAAEAEGDDDSPLNALINDLDYDLPRLGSYASDRKERINDFIKQAEVALHDGKYFNAENLFRQVLTDDPKQPLARAGMIHAQLGGGMIRSAAFNMRRLFAEHPELIAMRYDEKLLPPAERLGWLQKQLQSMIGRGDHSGEPGMMLAYLGYQSNTPNLVAFGLDIAQSQDPNDELVPVLRRIWLKNKDK